MFAVADPGFANGGQGRTPEGERGVSPSPLGEGSGEGAVPPPQKIFLTLDLKMSTFSAF